MKDNDTMHSTLSLSPISRPQTTADEVEKRIIMAIATGDKKAGERITERELAQIFDISRIPVREAMKRLLLHGVLEESGKRGVIVTDYNHEKIIELTELRLAIEKMALSKIMSGEHDNEPLFKELEGLVTLMLEFANTADVLVLSKIDLDFHRAIVKYSNYKFAPKIWEGLSQHMMVLFCQEWNIASNKFSQATLHKELINFIRSGSPTDIDKILREHLKFLKPHSLKN